MRTQFTIQNAREIVPFPLGPSGDGSAKRVQAPSLYAAFNFKGKQYRTARKRETFAPCWGDKFYLDLAEAGDSTPTNSFVTLRIIDEATGMTHTNVDIDLAQSYEGPVPTNSSGYVTVKVLPLPPVDMYVPGYPLVSVGPLSGYRGTVYLPMDILEDGKSFQPAVYNSEGLAMKNAIPGVASRYSDGSCYRRAAGSDVSRSGQKHSNRPSQPMIQARGHGYGSGSQTSRQSRAVMNRGQSDSGFNFNGFGGWMTKLAEKDWTAEIDNLRDLDRSKIERIVSLFGDNFGWDDVVNVFLNSGMDVNKAIDDLLDVQIDKFVETTGADKIKQETMAFESPKHGSSEPAREEFSLADFGSRSPPETHPHQNFGEKTLRAAEVNVPYIHNGYKKSLLVGVNYFNTRAELAGCVADVRRMRKLLKNVYSFPTNSSRMTILTDDQKDRRFHPTRANILNGFRWLTSDTRPGDSLFFHFSGHGAQVPTDKRYELDGLDETILPSDWERNGMILDEEIHELLVDHLPEGVRLTCVMDCCHSGTMIDLSYTYEKAPRCFKPYHNPFKASCDAILISGSKDSQTSADIGGNEKFDAGGAMTMSLIETLMEDPYNTTYDQLVNRLHHKLDVGKFTQKPCLSATQNFSTRQVFSFTDINSNQHEEVGRLEQRPPQPLPQPNKGGCFCCGNQKSVQIENPTEFVYRQVMGQGTGLE